MSVLDKAYFYNEREAFRHLERVLWKDGVTCPHCGRIGGSAGRLQGVKGKNGKARLGLWKCYEKECRKQFTVRVGTVFESAHIPLHKMLQAVHLMASSKKGISAHQLHRILEIQYKSAWFLAHRIREAMRDFGFDPVGGEGDIVEADETYFGRLAGQPAKGGTASKNIVLTLVKRGGKARSFHVEDTSIATIVPIVRENIARDAHLMTDEARHYISVGKEYASHGAVNHGQEEYVRREKGGRVVTTNTVEGYFSVFKRGMKGVYQHCSEKHLHRYLAEFDFRYNNRSALGVEDRERAANALAGAVGKRLTYRWPNQVKG